jgi:hypothetical protein
LSPESYDKYDARNYLRKNNKKSSEPDYPNGNNEPDGNNGPNDN